MKQLLYLTILVLVASSVTAAMDPLLKECLQRGYDLAAETEVTNCVMPDGTNCEIRAFNEQSCGAEFFVLDYCVAEDDPVWDDDKCCPGTEKYLPPKVAGQPRCVDSSTLQTGTNGMIIIIAIAVVIVAAAFIFLAKKKN